MEGFEWVRRTSTHWSVSGGWRISLRPARRDFGGQDGEQGTRTREGGRRKEWRGSGLRTRWGRGQVGTNLLRQAT